MHPTWMHANRGSVFADAPPATKVPKREKLFTTCVDCDAVIAVAKARCPYHEEMHRKIRQLRFNYKNDPEKMELKINQLRDRDGYCASTDEVCSHESESPGRLHDYAELDDVMICRYCSRIRE